MINGHKWFTSNGSVADFLIVMAVTNPDVHPYQGCSMIIVPVDTPGVDIVRDVATMEDPDTPFGTFGDHAEIVYRDVRVPVENLVGCEGVGVRAGPEAAGPGPDPPLHALAGPVPAGLRHAVRAGGVALRPRVAAGREADHPELGGRLAWPRCTAARLMTLQAAWKMDQEGAAAARVEIAMIKYYGAEVLYNVIDRAIQVHGSLGFSTDLPLEPMYRARPGGPHLRRARRGAQGQTVARQVLKGYTPPRCRPSTSPPGGPRRSGASPTCWRT